MRKKTIFYVLNLNAITDEQDVEDTIVQQLNASTLGTFDSFNEWVSFFLANVYRLVIVIPEAEYFLTPENNSGLKILSKLALENDGVVSIVSLFEKNILDDIYSKYVSIGDQLFQNIFYYPLYDQDDSLKFIRYFQKRWDLKVSNKEENEIITQSGGHSLLLVQCLRQIANSNHYAFDDEIMRIRLRDISSSLSERERRVLLALNNTSYISQSELHDVKRIATYFKLMRVFNMHDTCLFPALARFISEENVSKRLLIFENGKILFNSVPIDRMFSNKERRVMRLLLERSGEVISRDAIAICLWPINTQEEYSDWAIDQIVARIRKRLKDFDLPKTFIRAQRGKGYRLTIT